MLEMVFRVGFSAAGHRGGQRGVEVFFHLVAFENPLPRNEVARVALL